MIIPWGGFNVLECFGYTSCFYQGCGCLRTISTLVVYIVFQNVFFVLLKILQQQQVFKTSADSFDQILILFGLSPVVMICNGNMLFFANAWHTLPAKQVESFGEEDHPATRSNHD